MSEEKWLEPLLTNHGKLSDIVVTNYNPRKFQRLGVKFEFRLKTSNGQQNGVTRLSIIDC